MRQIYITKVIKPNGVIKYYGGKHTSDNPNYIGSGKFIKDLKKHFRNNPERKDLYKIYHKRWGNFQNDNELDLAEIKLISSLRKKYGSNCVNICNGGEGVSKEITRKRVEEGTHHLLSGNIQREYQLKRVAEGTHYLSCLSKERVKNGTHNFLGVLPWNNNKASSRSLYIWSKANVYYKWWMNNKKGCRAMATAFKEKWSTSHYNIIKKFKSGWIPNRDQNWIKFNQQYIGENNVKYLY